MVLSKKREQSGNRNAFYCRFYNPPSFLNLACHNPRLPLKSHFMLSSRLSIHCILKPGWMEPSSFLQHTFTYTISPPHPSHLLNFYWAFKSLANITLSEILFYLLIWINTHFVVLLIELLFLLNNISDTKIRGVFSPGTNQFWHELGVLQFNSTSFSGTTQS